MDHAQDPPRMGLVQKRGHPRPENQHPLHLPEQSPPVRVRPGRGRGHLRQGGEGLERLQDGGPQGAEVVEHGGSAAAGEEPHTLAGEQHGEHHQPGFQEAQGGHREEAVLAGAARPFVVALQLSLGQAQVFVLRQGEHPRDKLLLGDLNQLQRPGNIRAPPHSTHHHPSRRHSRQRLLSPTLHHMPDINQVVSQHPAEVL
mmetsp:Transcript_51044/g.134488  ORF Transcript_51044/g.134488 Transcript_51044/m.134488 type:complete len:200 (-) Transcript_51044:353-952(-)